MLALGVNLFRQKRFTEAEARMRACLRIRDKLAPDAWTTFNAKSLLGDALLAQQKYDDAEPLLLAATRGSKSGRRELPKTEKIRLTRPPSGSCNFTPLGARQTRPKRCRRNVTRSSCRRSEEIALPAGAGALPQAL